MTYRRAAEGGLAADILTLAWLDARTFWNRLRAIASDRRRLLTWTLFLIWLGFWGAYTRRHAAGPAPFQTVDFVNAAAALAPPLALVALGLGILSGASRAPALFRSPADGRFLCGSRLCPRAVVLWLSLRNAWRWLKGVAWGFFLAWFFAATGAGGGRALHYAGTAVSVAFVAAAASIARLPAFALGRRSGRSAPTALGAALVCLGLAWLARVLAAAFAVEPAARLAELAARGRSEPFSVLFHRAWLGDAWALLPFAALLAAALALASLSGDDVYPELWASALRAFEIREAVRRQGRWGARKAGLPSEGGRAARATRARSASGALAPPGPWVVLWRDLLQLVRSGLGLRGSLALLLAAALAGVVAGRFMGPGSDSAVTFLSIFTGYAGLFLNVLTATRLGTDLRRPLWWLSAAPLRWRLAARNVSQTILWAVPTCTFLIAAAAAGGVPEVAALLCPVVLAGFWLVQGIALAAYAVIPAGSDMRGPGGFLRMLALFACLAPPAGAGVLGGMAAGGAVPAGLAVAILVALGEGWVMTAFAAGRIAERGMTFAAAEER